MLGKLLQQLVWRNSVFHENKEEEFTKGKGFSFQGFTLIELLVVLAVLAVVVGAVVAAINPAQQIRRANDGRVKNDVGSLATAAQSFFVIYQSYPNSPSLLVSRGELSKLPSAPSDYIQYDIKTNPGDCDPDYPNKVCTGIAIYGEIKAPKTSGNNRWCWKSDGGAAFETTDALCTAP